MKINKQRLAQLEQLSYGNAAFVMETTLQSIMLAYYRASAGKGAAPILENNRRFQKSGTTYVAWKELGGRSL